MEMIIAMITTIVHGDMIKTNDHLSERCLKLPSVGGNCRPFKGAFSFPGSGFWGENLKSVNSWMIGAWEDAFDPHLNLPWATLVGGE